MPDWKVLATVAVATIVIFTAAIASSGFDLGKTIGNIGDVGSIGSGISGLFGAVTGQEMKNVSIEAVFDRQPLAMDISSQKVELELEPETAQIIFGSVTIRPSQTIVVEEWQGTFSAGDIFEMAGNAKRITVDGKIIEPYGADKATLTITGKRPQRATLHGLSLPSLLFKQATGVVSIADGKASIRLDNEPVNIGKFSGEIILDAMMTIRGQTDSLIISGSNKLSVV